MPIKKKQPQSLIDSRHLKILSAKREELKNSIILVCADEERFGNEETGKAQLQTLVKKLDEIEPSAVYFPMFHKMTIQFYDRFEFKNKDILITIDHGEQEEDQDQIEAAVRKAVPEARSISFIHKSVEIENP